MKNQINKEIRNEDILKYMEKSNDWIVVSTKSLIGLGVDYGKFYEIVHAQHSVLYRFFINQKTFLSLGDSVCPDQNHQRSLKDMFDYYTKCEDLDGWRILND